MLKRIIAVVLLLISILSCLALSGCGDDYTARDLQDAKGRYFSGNASSSDKRMVEGFYKWKSNQ